MIGSCFSNSEILEALTDYHLDVRMMGHDADPAELHAKFLEQ